MKKSTKKLTLNRETLKPLTGLEPEKLQEVAGGGRTSDMLSCTCLN